MTAVLSTIGSPQHVVKRFDSTEYVDGIEAYLRFRGYIVRAVDFVKTPASGGSHRLSSCAICPGQPSGEYASIGVSMAPAGAAISPASSGSSVARIEASSRPRRP